MRRYLSFLTLSVLAVLATSILPASEPRIDDANKLVAHEWGTFTTLQDERGREIAGINIDDEPVPAFVHNLSPQILQPTFLGSPHWQRRMKGAPARHPRVTMRLETPVIYFHLPEGSKGPTELDVRVLFRGGWLTEFFPNAMAKAPGISSGRVFSDLHPSVVSSLEWQRLQVGKAGKFPETDAPVWTAPRQVDCDPVTTEKGESEQYLFYRGVANQRAPVRAVSSKDGKYLDIHGNFRDVLCKDDTKIRALWLVDIRADGAAAFREIDGVPVTRDEEEVLTTVDAKFSDDDYHPFNLVVLKKLMWIALTREGLYGDEAMAMLNTWNRAYFESPGRRLFFTVPRVWTDHYMPLEISKAEKIERVMIGRVELITQAQREILAELAVGEKADATWLKKIPPSKARDDFLAGRIGFGDLGVDIPEHFRKYLALGRFRNALIVDAEARLATPALTAFVDRYNLQHYRARDFKRPRAQAAKAVKSANATTVAATRTSANPGK